jgi:hypothetical protein
MRVDNRICTGGVDYVRLERGIVLVELYSGEKLRFKPEQEVRKDTQALTNKEIKEGVENYNLRHKRVIA